jgi:hypothetical protein
MRTAVPVRQAQGRRYGTQFKVCFLYAPAAVVEKRCRQSLQILTLRRVFLTAPCRRERHNQIMLTPSKRAIFSHLNQVAWTVSILAIRLAILFL